MLAQNLLPGTGWSEERPPLNELLHSLTENFEIHSSETSKNTVLRRKSSEMSKNAMLRET